MRKISKKKLIAGAAATAIIAGGAGVAFAYWSSTGTGSGTATTGTSSDFVVTIDSVNLADLTPGGATDTVTFHVHNPGTGAQNYASAVPSVTSTSNDGCTAGDFDVNLVSGGYADLAGNATANGSFTIKMKDTGVNQDACKGVTVNLQVVASGS